MVSVLIHACPHRMWYVEEFLVPALKEQGVEEIEVSCDYDGKGNLIACLERFEEVSKRPGDTWHLQDDVYPSTDFYDRVDGIADEEIICGFCHTLFEPFNRPMAGHVPAVFMFNSFPCIRIPNALAGEFVSWFWNDACKRSSYHDWVKSGKHDDGFWHDFVTEQHGSDWVWNMAPALVEHVDWIIGGSVTNDWRDYICRASYWEEEDRIKELQEAIARRRAQHMATRAETRASTH